MAKISKSADAPEGLIKVGVGSTSFKVDDDSPFETDDLTLLEYAASDPYLEVSHDERTSSKAAGKAELKALNELHKEQEKVHKQRATKDPLEPAAEMPTSVADLEGGKN